MQSPITNNQSPMKIGLVSLGCPKNLVDGEVMLGLAREAGHEITADARVGRCHRREHVRLHRSRQGRVGRRDPRDGAAQARRPCQRLVVTGCLAERYRDELKTEIPEIDVVLGTGEVPDIVEAISGGSSAGECRRVRRPSRCSARRDLVPIERGTRTGTPRPPRTRPGARPISTTPRHRDVLTTPRHYAYVKIAEGCDYTCAFCIIPTLRGAYRSRDEDSIVAEAESLAARGVRELLLISQDTTFFGIDRGERGALARLLRRLNRRRRARAGSACSTSTRRRSPTTCSTRWPSASKVCNYIDLPLQHASADVLKRMRRPGTRKTYDTLLARIRDARARRDPPHDVHRRVSRRDRTATSTSWRTSSATSDSITSACSPTRTRKARARSRMDDDVPARVKARRRARIMRAAAADRRAAAPGRRSEPRSASWSTAPRPTRRSS